LFVLLAKTKLDIIGGAKQKPLAVIVLSVLVVLSHQLAAVLLFVVLFWQFVNSLISKGNLSLKGLVVFIPSVFVFVWGFMVSLFVPIIVTVLCLFTCLLALGFLLLLIIF
jgi:hypothetical protein